MSIRLKLTIMFLAIASIPLLLVSALTFTNYKNSLEANHISQLRDLTIFRADRIEAYFAGLKAHIEITQGFYNIKKNLPVLTRLADDPNNPEFLAAKNMLDAQLQQMQSVSDLSDIMLVNPQGKVVYANKPGHYSKDLFNGYDAEQKAFAEGKDRIYYSDVYFDKAEDNRFEILLTAPAYDFNNAFIGVIAFEIDMTPAYKLIQDVTGLGNTGEVLIGKKIGNEVEFLNPLRHDPQAALKIKVALGDASAFPIQQAVQGRTGSGLSTDYRGKKVIAAWRYIPSLDWGMVAKIDTEEAFADVTNLKNLSIVIMVIVIVLSGIMAFSIAHSIFEPIKRLSKGAEIIGSGNLDYKIGTNLKDEIGQLSRSFDKMTHDLKQTTASRDELNREITERKKAEESLRESQTDLNRAQAVAHSGSWRLDVRQNKLTWSDEAYRIFGVPIGTGLTYEMFLTYIHPDDREYVDTKWKAALAGEKYDIEHRIVVDDQIKWVRERAELEIEKDGSISGGFGTVTDITERKNKEQELHKLNRTLRALSNSIQAMMQATDESEYLEKVCDIVVRDCGHVMSWVGFAEDDENKTVRPVANAGFEQGYLETLNITWADTERGRGPTGIAIRTGKPSMCRNIPTDPLFAPWRQDAIKRGYASSIALPLISDGKTFGALTIYSREPDPFSDDEVNLLTELADDLAYGIAAIKLRIAHTQAEEAVRKSRDELEVRVKERTAQLTHTVETLQEEVTRRTLAEEALRTASLYARGLLEASLDPLVTISPEGKITDVNEATIKVTGISREQLIGTDFSNYFTEPKKAQEGYKQVFAQGFVTDYPLTIRHRDGRLTDVLYNATVYKNEAGEIQGVFAAARDVTESKRVMRQFVETKNFLDNILQSSTKYSIIGKDLDHRILSWNEGAKRNYGYTAEEIIGQKSSILHTPEDIKSGAVDKLLTTAYKKGLAEGEFQRIRKDGTRFMASVVVTRRNDASGRPIGYLVMSNDISEKKQAEEQLQQASKYARSLIESSLDPLVTISREGKITDVNEATIKVTGISREQLIGTDFSDYFTEPEKAREGYKQVFADGFVTDYPLTIHHRDGMLTDVLYNATVYKDTHGKVIGVFAAARDVTVQKQASQYARSLIDSSLDPLVTISADGKVTDVNKATELITGATREQLIGTDFSDYFTEPEKAREGYKQVFADGFVTDYPLTIHHRDGTLTDVLYNAAVYKDTHGKVIGVFAAARDVTVQKQASQYARSLIESSLDPLVTISADGKITDVNKATELVTGAARGQLIGMDFSNYFTEPDKARKGYQQVFADGFVTDYPLTIRHRDGQLTDVLYNATVYKDTHGNVIGVFAAARDVTERKAAQERENVTNSLLQMFAQKVSRKAYLDSTVERICNWSGCEFIGIRIRDAEGNIPYESHIGFDKDFLALENALHLDRDKCICIRAILENPQQQEQKFMTAGGSFYCNDSLAFLKGLPEQHHKEYRANCMKMGFQSIAVIPIRYHERVTGAIHITDFKKGMVPLSKIQFIETSIAPLIGEAVQRFTAEAELEKHRLHLEELVKQRTEELTRSNKELEQFAYVASHDLQEPLRMISGYTQLLQRRYKDKLDEDANQFIFYTVDGVLRMQTLINDLLTYSRLETRGKAFEPANCKAILDDVLVTLQTSIEESSAIITHGPLPTVRADRIQLFQLFQNLISNAIKFRGDKPPLIHIEAKPQQKQWLFSVRDNGIGIEPQYMERIFVIFQRLHSRDKYPGTGIGLAICKKIVERHGGRIWVESQPGNGSTFYFII